MSVFSGEQGKKQAFLVVLPGKLDLENSPLMLGFFFFFFFLLWEASTSQQENLIPFPRVVFRFPG